MGGDVYLLSSEQFVLPVTDKKPQEWYRTPRNKEAWNRALGQTVCKVPPLVRSIPRASNQIDIMKEGRRLCLTDRMIHVAHKKNKTTIPLSSDQNAFGGKIDMLLGK